MRRIWKALRNFYKAHPLVIAYLLMLVVFTVGLWRVNDYARDVETQAQRTERVARQTADLVKRIEQTAVDNDYKTCLSGNLLRSGLRHFLEATASSGGSVVDPTTIPEFGRMDKETQEFFVAFIKVVNAPRSPEDNRLLQQAAVYFGPRNCTGLYPTHTPGVELPPDAVTGQPAPPGAPSSP